MNTVEQLDVIKVAVERNGEVEELQGEFVLAIALDKVPSLKSPGSSNQVILSGGCNVPALCLVLESIVEEITEAMLSLEFSSDGIKEMISMAVSFGIDKGLQDKEK